MLYSENGEIRISKLVAYTLVNLYTQALETPYRFHNLYIKVTNKMEVIDGVNP